MDCSIRISTDQSPFAAPRSFSQLIAACHVLLRLLMPRHSPCALLSLIFFLRSLLLSRVLFALCEQVFLKKLCFAVCFTLLPQDFKTFSLTLAFALLSKYHYLACKVQMVGLGGLEPPTSRLSGVRSNLLSYRPNSDIKISDVVEMRRIELLTPCLQGRCSPS